MHVKLSDDDAQTLRGLLLDYLPELTFELSRTDGMVLRHVLAKRQTLCERLLEQLCRITNPTQRQRKPSERCR